MDSFDQQIRAHRDSVERFVYYHMSSRADAEDVIQDVWLKAYEKRDTLHSPEAFLSWVLSIARNRMRDYYRACGRREALPAPEIYGRTGSLPSALVRETLMEMSAADREILTLYYLRDEKQTEIADRLHIPLGTVKSRLHLAKRHFRRAYPLAPKGETLMNMPQIMPEYRIIPSDKPVFPVRHEELMGWFIVPREGESVTWAMYDQPSRKIDCQYELRVTGRAEIHGVEGVEISVHETGAHTSSLDRVFIAQLTDTHSRYLAVRRTENGVKRLISFLDGSSFDNTWGFGADNCGNEIFLSPRGQIRANGNTISADEVPFLDDLTGRFTIEIGGKEFDTVRLIEIVSPHCDVITEQYLDADGRTILWRRFNRDDWHYNEDTRLWHDRLPTNETLTVNGTTYVHWYDCLISSAL